MSGWRRWLIMLLSVLAIGCSPAPVSPVTAPAPAAPVETFQPPIEAIATHLSEQTQIPRDDLQVERIEATNWPDSCLGLAQPNEMCAQAITPGFRVEFAAPQGRYVVHSDRSGRSIRLKP